MKREETGQTESLSTEYLWRIRALVLSALPYTSISYQIPFCERVIALHESFSTSKTCDCSGIVGNLISFETKLLKLRMEGKQGAYQNLEKEARVKQGKNDGEAEMPALKHPLSWVHICSLWVFYFFIALPWQPEQCWKALSLWCWLKMIFPIMHLASN